MSAKHERQKHPINIRYGSHALFQNEIELSTVGSSDKESSTPESHDDITKDILDL